MAKPSQLGQPSRTQLDRTVRGGCRMIGGLDGDLVNMQFSNYHAQLNIEDIATLRNFLTSALGAIRKNQAEASRV